MEDKYFFNNGWHVSHPTIDFFAFDAYCVEVFGHKCIVEHVQDGEIWDDNEYYGTMFYDFENDRYVYISYYLDDGKEIERILKNWMNYEENPDDIWTGKISEDFVNNKELFHFSYQRYLINCFRNNFGLQGTPVRLIVREKSSKDFR